MNDKNGTNGNAAENGQSGNGNPKKKFTPKQKLFIKHYKKTFNGAKSAKLAGYSKKSAKEIACETLTIPHVRAEISNYITELEKQLPDKERAELTVQGARAKDYDKRIKYLTLISKVRREMSDSDVPPINNQQLIIVLGGSGLDSVR